MKLIFSRKKHGGFTLVEMAVVLVIIGLLLGGLLVPLSTQVENERRTQTQKKLEEIKEALLGFAIVNDRLPCPDTNADGSEDTGCGANAFGDIPWQQLGVANQDSWGQTFKYGVDVGFTSVFNLTTVGNLRVCTDNTCGTILANQIPAVVFSTGKEFIPRSADEIENTDGANNDYVSRTLNTVAASEFDDIIIWLSPNILFNQMVSAGRLP